MDCHLSVSEVDIHSLGLLLDPVEPSQLDLIVGVPAHPAQGGAGAGAGAGVGVGAGAGAGESYLSTFPHSLYQSD